LNINTLFSIAVLATKKTPTSLNLITTTTEICVDIPSDAYPIFLCLDNSFKVYSQHEPIFANKAQIQDFSDYVKSMPEWIYSLIRHYTVHPSSHSLLYHIINKYQLLISTNGSRTHNKSGCSWIITLTDGKKLISGHNPEFGTHVDINSYHSKIYASLSSLAFTPVKQRHPCNLAILSCLPTNFVITHIKGHQDEQKSY